MATSYFSQVSKSPKSVSVSRGGSLKTCLGKWQKVLGLEGWKITLLREQTEDCDETGYPGHEAAEPPFQAGWCLVDSHGLRAIIYVAPTKALSTQGLLPEAVLLHELLHVRLDALCTVPAQEPIGRALLLENAVNSLSRALLGMKLAA